MPCLSIWAVWDLFLFRDLICPWEEVDRILGVLRLLLPLAILVLLPFLFIRRLFKLERFEFMPPDFYITEHPLLTAAMFAWMKFFLDPDLILMLLRLLPFHFTEESFDFTDFDLDFLPDLTLDLIIDLSDLVLDLRDLGDLDCLKDTFDWFVKHEPRLSEALDLALLFLPVLGQFSLKNDTSCSRSLLGLVWAHLVFGDLPLSTARHFLSLGNSCLVKYV